MIKNTILALFIGAFFITSCKKEENTPAPKIISGTKTLTVAFDPLGTKNFTLFRFSDSSVVPNQDSISDKWDFGLRFADIIVNSLDGGGPGNAGVILQNGIFENINEAPATGYAYDTTTSKRAIKRGSWYIYTPAPPPALPTFTTIPGKIFIFRTANGKNFAKMEILTVNYQLEGNMPKALLYKIRFTYQPNGSTNF